MDDSFFAFAASPAANDSVGDTIQTFIIAFDQPYTQEKTPVPHIRF